MKNRFFLGLPALAALPFFFLSCTENPDGGDLELPAALNDMVEVLENSVKEASDFTSILKQTDLSDVESDELTIFAVKNGAFSKGTGTSEQISVRRHVVIGSYGPESLTDKTELTSVSGEKLEVSESADVTRINGIAVIGNAIPAGNGYIYLVESPIPSEPVQNPDPEEPGTDIDPEKWEAALHDFWFSTRELNQKLSYGYDGFSYDNISKVSEEYWDTAYRTVDTGLELLKSMNEKNINDIVYLKARLGIALIYSDILRFYGTCVFKGNDSDPHNNLNYLKNELSELAEYLPSEYSAAAHAVYARVSLEQKDYRNALEMCRLIIDSGEYALSTPPESVFASMDNTGTVWAGCEDTDPLRKGNYYHPIRYAEVMLLAAEAANGLGQTPSKAMEYINQIALWKGMAPMVLPSTPTEEVTEFIIKLYDNELRNEGLEYPLWRRTDVADEKLRNINGYDSHNSLLPVPDKAMSQYEFLQQNPGY